MRYDFESMRQYAYGMLDEKRIKHVQGCESEAVSLAKRWGADEDDARAAAILHDITKNRSLEWQLKFCEEHDIPTDEIERQSGKLLHSKTASEIAKSRFGVNKNVSDAILWHTTGKAGMSLYDKIMYIADYIEPNRDFDGLAELRKLAYEDLDAAIRLGIDMSVSELRQKNAVIHPNSLDCASFYREIKEL